MKWAILAILAFILMHAFIGALAENVENVENVEKVENEDSIINDINSSEMWAIYRSELVMFLSKGKNNLQNLQLLPSPMFVEWGKNSAEFQTFANSRMRFGNGWSLDMNTFSSAYEEFINAIDFKYRSVKPSPVLEHLYEKESDAAFEYEMEYGKCLQRYAAFPEAIRGTFEQFELNTCPSVSRKFNEFMTAKASAEKLGRSMYPSEKEYMAGKAIGKFASTVQHKFIELNPLADFMRRNSNGEVNRAEFTVDSSSSSSTAKSSWSSFSFSLGFPGFFSVGVNSSKQKMSMTTKAQQFKITIGAESYGTVRVVPDPSWFDGNFVRAWANGPYKPGYNRNSFFGQNGKMSMIPQIFYVFSKPKVEMTLNREDASQFSSAKSSGFSLSIGPISFNMAKAKTTQKETGRDNLIQFKIESTDPTPQLIAVKGDILPF